MGSQEDKIQKALDQYTKKKNWSSKGWLKILKDNVGKDEWKRLQKEVAKPSPPFKHFHKEWSKSNILKVWKGNTWESVIDFCKLTNIKPKQVMNYVAGLKVNKTDKKTIQIAGLVNNTKSKLPLRSKAINLSKKLIEIDSKLKQGDKETPKHWQERIYRKVYKSLKRFDL
jgi:hypothetical protein